MWCVCVSDCFFVKSVTHLHNRTIALSPTPALCLGHAVRVAVNGVCSVMNAVTPNRCHQSFLPPIVAAMHGTDRTWIVYADRTQRT